MVDAEHTVLIQKCNVKPFLKGHSHVCPFCHNYVCMSECLICSRLCSQGYWENPWDCKFANRAFYLFVCGVQFVSSLHRRVKEEKVEVVLGSARVRKQQVAVHFTVD